MKFDDATILDLCGKYSVTQLACRSFDEEVINLAAAGDHKHKNKLIRSRGIKLSVARNEALNALQKCLDAIAEMGMNPKVEAKIQRTDK